MDKSRKRKLLLGILQPLARRELGHLLGLDLDCLTCLGVVPLPGCSLGYLEGSEPDDSHVSTLLQGLGDGFEYGIDSSRSLLLRTGYLLDFLDEIARMRPSTTQSVEGRDDGPDLSDEQNCQPALAL